MTRANLRVKTMRGIGIGTGLRRERRPSEPRADVQTRQHRGQSRIGSDAQRTLADNLERYVPVAEMPSDASEFTRAPDVDIDDLLGRRDDADVAALGKAQAGAVGEYNRALQIKEEG
jgi:hypothetical protein